MPATRRLNIKPARPTKGRTIRLIEEHPKAGKREVIFSGGGKKFRQPKQTGNRKYTTILSGKYPKGFFFVHTHIPKEKHQTVSALPSVADIGMLSELIRTGRNRAGAIVSLDWNGKAKGYVIYKLDRPVSHEDNLSLEEYVKEKTTFSRGTGKNKNIQGVPQFYKRYIEALQDFLEERGYRFEQIIAPMQGYRFDENICAFVKARKRL